MANTFKIGYLPLSKVNWTNDTLEAASGRRTVPTCSSRTS